MAEENRSWGYDRVVGALANLGHEVSDQTVAQCSCAMSRSAARTGAQAHNHLGSIHSSPPGGAGGDRLFHSGGPYAARTGDTLRPVFHPS